MAAEREKIYDMEVKRRRVAAGGGYEPFWKIKSVKDALADNDSEFRCKDCHGEMKVLGKTGKAGTVPYVEHKLPADSEYCSNGMLFKKATDGREPKHSDKPIN